MALMIQISMGEALLHRTPCAKYGESRATHSLSEEKNHLFVREKNTRPIR